MIAAALPHVFEICEGDLRVSGGDMFIFALFWVHPEQRH